MVRLEVVEVSFFFLFSSRKNHVIVIHPPSFSITTELTPEVLKMLSQPTPSSTGQKVFGKLFSRQSPMGTSSNVEPQVGGNETIRSLPPSAFPLPNLSITTPPSLTQSSPHKEGNQLSLSSPAPPSVPSKT